MELAPPGVVSTFEVTYDQSGLDVGMSVYDTTTGTPSLVQAPTAMTNVVANTYVGNFIPQGNKTYLIFKAVYTDNTFTTIDQSYGQSSESINTVVEGGGGGTTAVPLAVVGYVIANPVLVGTVIT